LELDVLALHAPRQFPTLQADGGGASEEEQRGSRFLGPIKNGPLHMRIAEDPLMRKGLSVAKVLGAIQLGLGPDEASVSDS